MSKAQNIANESIQRIQQNIASFRRSEVHFTGDLNVTPAARVTDIIKHKSFWAALAGAVAGAIIGACIYAVASAIIVASGGTALIAVAAVTAVLTTSSFVCDTDPISALSSEVEEITNALFFSAPDGAIVEGSHNVTVNGLPLAHVLGANTVACKDHPPSIIGLGSETAFVNAFNVARKDDKITCGAAIKTGSPDVFFGSGQAQCASIDSDLAWWQEGIIFAIEFLIPPSAAFKNSIKKGAKLIATQGLKTAVTRGARIGTVMLKKSARMAKKMWKHRHCAIAAFKENKSIARFKKAMHKLKHGDPIDPLTGHLIEQRTDFTLGQTLPLHFTRTWSRHKDERHQHGLTGRYWVDTFSEYVEISQNGQHIKIATHEGTYLRFALPHGSLQSFNPEHPQFLLHRVRHHFYLYNRDTQVTKQFNLATPEFFQHDNALGYPNLNDGIFPIEQWRDEFNNHIDFIYNDDQLATVKHSDGIELALRYKNNWLHQVVRTDLTQHQILATYFQDEQGRLIESDALNDFHLYYQYDHRDNLTRWADNDQTWTKYDYDEQGRCVHSIGAEGFYPVWFEYQDGVTTVYDSQKNATRYEFDPHIMQPRVTTLPNGTQITYQYDCYGNLLQQTFPDGRSIEMEYFADTGLVTTFTDATGLEWRYDYHEDETLSEVTDPLGRTWKNEEYFDDVTQQHITRFIAPDGSVSELVQNEYGLLTEAKQQFDKITHKERFFYDPRHQLIAQQDSEQRRIELAYDSNDRVASLRNAKGAQWHYRYSSHNKLTQIDNPNQSQEHQQYDRHGNLIQYTDGNGVIWQLKYGAFDLLIEKIDGEGHCWHYDYDKDTLKLRQVTNPQGETYRYEFDNMGNIISECDFANNQWHYQYDPLTGQLNQLTNGADECTQFKYNEANQIQHVLTADGGFCAYEYDVIGRVSAVHTLDSQIAVQYDILDRVVKETHSHHHIEREYPDAHTMVRHLYIDDQCLTTTYQTNRVGELTTLTLPNQQQLHFEYDAQGNEVHRASDEGFILNQHYDAMDCVVHQRAGNEPTRFFDSDELRQSGIASPSFAKLNRTYQYDKALNTIAANDAQEQLQLQVNGNNQITAVVENQRLRERYHYDANGYVTQRAVGHPAYGIIDDEFDGNYNQQAQRVHHGGIYTKGNQLHRLNEQHYKYDAAGRLISKTIQQDGFRQGRSERFSWNGFNQLTTFNDRYQQQWHYKYDGLGRRVEKYCPKQNLRTTYLWDGDQLALTRTFKNDELISQRHSVFNGWELIAQQDEYSPQHAANTHPNDLKLQWKQETNYPVSQPNGKILALFSPKGELRWRGEKKSLWGLVLSAYRSSIPNPVDPQMLFSGQWVDNESGLAYNRFRYYDPETACYLSSDPIGLNGGEQPYGYVHNAWGWVDPWGLAKCPKVSANTKVSGNSKASTKAQHGYVIVDTHTGKIAKVGVSGGKINKNYSSRRANVQVSKWNRVPGNAGRYRARVVMHIGAGPGARSKILKWENATANKLRALNAKHLNDRNLHKRP